MYEEVLLHSQTSLKLQTSLQLGDVYINLGSAHNSLAQYEKAIEFYEQARLEYGKAGFQSPACLGGLGNAHYNLGNYLKSLRFCRDALHQYEEKGEKGDRQPSMGTWEMRIMLSVE